MSRPPDPSPPFRLRRAWPPLAAAAAFAVATSIAALAVILAGLHAAQGGGAVPPPVFIIAEGLVAALHLCALFLVSNPLGIVRLARAAG